MGWGVGLSSLNLSGSNSPQLAASSLHLPEVRHSCMLLAGIQGGCSDWTPDPFDLAQGRGEHSRTTIKTFGG
jgi:hypothetical protein